MSDNTTLKEKIECYFGPEPPIIEKNVMQRPIIDIPFQMRIQSFKENADAQERAEQEWYNMQKDSTIINGWSVKNLCVLENTLEPAIIIHNLNQGYDLLVKLSDYNIQKSNIIAYGHKMSHVHESMKKIFPVVGAIYKHFKAGLPGQFGTGRYIVLNVCGSTMYDFFVVYRTEDTSIHRLPWAKELTNWIAKVPNPRSNGEPIERFQLIEPPPSVGKEDKEGNGSTQ